MSGTITNATCQNALDSPFRGRRKLWVVLLIICFVASFIKVSGQSNITPAYNWLKQEKLPTVNVNLATLSVNSEDITIAVATDPEGNVYTLTFGKGVTKRNSEGVLLNDNFIPANILPSPLDLAIDQNGYIYVATYLPEGEYQDNGQIKVFDTQGNFVRSILTSFYRPMGLDVDENFVYAAEYYDGKKGPEQGSVYSRIRIYNKLSGSLVKESNQVQIPMRIAIDSNKNVYVSQAGYSNNSEVRIFNENLIYQTVLPNITSPGSIVIDEFDFIHVIEYAGRIDFSRFIDFESLSFSEVQTIAKNIDDAQRAKAFSIKIFDLNRSLKLTFKDQLDFPVDLTFNQCDRMYVNNSKIFGNNVFIIGYLPDRLEFDLEIYKRTPSLDTQKPLLSCPANITVTAAAGETTAVVNYTAPIPTDNCSTPVLTRTGPGPNSNFPIGTTPITYTATDDAGNVETCVFTITVNPAEEEE
ncbi:MAG TPA: HYR domain-containing protein, partial [Gillisia sp.]|nr:HYR domain-containing protein [Gillisia sp.]